MTIIKLVFIALLPFGNCYSEHGCNYLVKEAQNLYHNEVLNPTDPMSLNSEKAKQQFYLQNVKNAARSWQPFCVSHLVR